MTEWIKKGKRVSCDDTHINEHTKKDTPQCDVPEYSIDDRYWNYEYLSHIDIIYKRISIT